MGNGTELIDVQLLAAKLEALEDGIDAVFERLEQLQELVATLKLRPVHTPPRAPQLGCRCYEDR